METVFHGGATWCGSLLGLVSEYGVLVYIYPRVAELPIQRGATGLEGLERGRVILSRGL